MRAEVGAGRAERGRCGARVDDGDRGEGGGGDMGVGAAAPMG